MSPENPPLAGRVALLTGASGGIGGAIALKLAAEGVDVALAYGRSRDEAEAVASRLAGLGRRAILLQGDLADAEVPGRLVAETVRQLGACDVLIANAGVAELMPWNEVELDTWNRAMDVNLRAPLLLDARRPSRHARARLWAHPLCLLGGCAERRCRRPALRRQQGGAAGLMRHIASRVAGRGA